MSISDYPQSCRYMNLKGPVVDTGDTWTTPQMGIVYPVVKVEGAEMKFSKDDGFYMGPLVGRWSNERLPKIGDKVRVTFNQLGTGKIISFFSDGGDLSKNKSPYIGVEVLADNRPKWHVKQNPGQLSYHVFGAEIEFLE